MLDVQQLRDYLNEHHTFDMLRVQTLPHYDVTSDGGDFRAYLRGEPGPDPARKGPWLDRLRELTAAGRGWRVVHVLKTPLSDYLRYGCEWGYALNVEAGQKIRILDVTGDDLAGSLCAVGDFYIVDRRSLVRMHYDDEGRFVGAEPITSGSTLSNVLHSTGELAWQRAEPFESWWDRHPEDHRDGRRAA